MGNSVLKVDSIYKSFNGVDALIDVSFELKKGEVHAIIGENGAGKSTLMNIISGIYKKDKGSIYIKSQKTNIFGPRKAQELGIGFVPQKIVLCPEISVAENIFMEKINTTKEVFLDYLKLNKEAEKLLEEFNVNINPASKVSDLSISQQQIVQIAKTLSSKTIEILIFDEPTTSLTETESKVLFDIINDLKSKDISIIYISHKLSEVLEICDRVTVLRDGYYIDTLKNSEINEFALINKMVGRELKDLYPKKSDKVKDEALLEVINLTGYNFNNINFKLKKGEILGFSGLVGAGRSEAIKSICGLEDKKSGKIFLNGRKIVINDYRDAIDNGIVYLTEDRLTSGLFFKMDIKRNISALNLDQVSNGFFIDHKKELKQANKYFKKLDIRSYGVSQKVLNLSGGNQQKVLISKLLSVSPKILFMDEPTKGIDVGAKQEINKLLRDLADQGIGVVLISSDLPEIIGMCDRVITMHEGKITGKVTGKKINEKDIMYLCCSKRDNDI